MLELIQQKYFGIMVGTGRNNFIIEWNNNREADIAYMRPEEGGVVTEEAEAQSVNAQEISAENEGEENVKSEDEPASKDDLA